MDEKNWEEFFSVTKASLSVTNEYEFNVWRQSMLCKFLSHDVMICSWGNFNYGYLDHNVANAAGKQKIIESNCCKLLDRMMANLYQIWEKNNFRWFMLDSDSDGFPATGSLNLEKTEKYQGKQMLAYGIRGIGDGNSSLYVFLSQDPAINVEHYAIGMLMPYVDSALRRIKSIQPVGHSSNYSLLTARELQIMEWVNHGKTNYEIGIILSISPNTVKNHLKKVFSKLNVSSRAQAVSAFANHL